MAPLSLQRKQVGDEKTCQAGPILKFQIVAMVTIFGLGQWNLVYTTSTTSYLCIQNADS